MCFSSAWYHACLCFAYILGMELKSLVFQGIALWTEPVIALRDLEL